MLSVCVKPLRTKCEGTLCAKLLLWFVSLYPQAVSLQAHFTASKFRKNKVFNFQFMYF